jgi:DNA-binding NtrC family response regulator
MASKVLFVSGNRKDARTLARMLQSVPLAVDHAPSIQIARTKLTQGDYEIVLTEACLPDGKWLDVLHLVRDSGQPTEVIVTDPRADSEFWAEALNLGAYDLLAQPFYEPEVRRILCSACSRPLHHSQPYTMAAV